MDIIEVVCGIIFNGDKVFICRRKEGKSLAGFWEFPGGKIEEKESHRNALKRELEEELEMTVSVLELIGQSKWDYGNFKIELFGYKCKLIKYQGKLTDHDSFEWLDISELEDRNMAPADIPLIRMIVNQR